MPPLSRRRCLHCRVQGAASAEASVDDVSRVTSNSAGVAADTRSELEVKADDDDEEESRRRLAAASAVPGKLDIVLEILAAMCDGQFTDLQVSACMT